MNRVNIQIKNIDRIKRSFIENANFSAIPKIQLLIRDRMRELIPDMIVETLRDTDTYKGLAGQYANDATGRDLQAEFGLSAGMAEDVLDKLERLLRESIRVDRSNVSGNLLRVYAAKDLDSKLTNTIRGATYTASGGREIPWMEWVLAGENTAPIHADIFYGDFPSSRSNSERAIMVNKGVGFWTYDTTERPNFIQFAISSPVFAQKVRAHYGRILKEILRAKSR